ncbi:MAG: putative DNA binding domain-containing protein [Chloroflexi bacterium]|nr:putative DNA binding domain-containing protein [Chloroflexota bacterium]
MANKKNRSTMKWHSMDLHLHTPASSDYQDADTSYLDILQQAETQGLEIIAFSDHNTVAGYRKLMEEIDQLSLLKKLDRILPDEELKLIEYQRLLKKLLVLPGFEFTATLGFHILAIFSPDKPVREIEHLLLNLNIPASQLDEGSVTVGASADVLRAYEVINKDGGIVIAAHANSTNGVAMRGYGFGGQTKIAYTQDSNLHALEVTDLENRGRRTTAAFFSGTKPEYPRRMHCIQGSDAHRLISESRGKRNFGVGGRVTEVLIQQVSFEALKLLFESNDFARTRPLRKKKGEPVYDFIRAAREEGSNIVQDFHASMTLRGGNLYTIIADVCAFANTNGGTLYVGISPDQNTKIVGVNNPGQAVKQLEREIGNRISPPINCTVDSHKSGGKNIIRVLVPRGEDPPYAVEDSKIYIRGEAETGLAVRDEIVGLVNRKRRAKNEPTEQVAQPKVKDVTSTNGKQKSARKEEYPPKTGVEIVSVNERNGTKYFTVKDLRNGNVVTNVTEKSARSLWHYAITNFLKMPKDKSKISIDWQGELGILSTSKQGKSVRYDLVQRNGKEYRYYFGVTDDGIHGSWRNVVGSED